MIYELFYLIINELLIRWYDKWRNDSFVTVKRIAKKKTNEEISEREREREY